MASTTNSNGTIYAPSGSTDSINNSSNGESDFTKQYEIPSPAPITSFTALKDRIRHHYELASDYYYTLWGEHIHHGYFIDPTDTKERAQTQLIDLLLARSKLTKGANVLDVGCGIGGTTRYLARYHACHVLGITISGKQVDMATKLAIAEAGDGQAVGVHGIVRIANGSVQFEELDAEKMAEHFSPELDLMCVWISEALSHFPNKKLFFENAFINLDLEGKLVVADWFKAEGLTAEQLDADIKPIEDGMLLPPLCTQSEYVRMAHEAGFEVFSEPLDISKDVAKTWDISWSLIQNPAIWAFAFSQGRDGIAFLQAFRAMRRGYAHGTFRYAVMVFQRPMPCESSEDEKPIA